MTISLKALLSEQFSDADMEDVFATAQMAHMGQKRRSGEDYFIHPKEVAAIVASFYPSDKISNVVAMLHDTIEDAPGVGTVKDVEEMKQFIKGSIGDERVADEVVHAVDKLSHDKETQDYSEYVAGIGDDPVVMRVKLADMLHNLTHSPSEKQVMKYGNALQTIGTQFNGKPGSISPSHWSALEKAAGVSLMKEERPTGNKTMKITKEQLKEAVRRVVKEQMDHSPPMHQEQQEEEDNGYEGEFSGEEIRKALKFTEMWAMKEKDGKLQNALEIYVMEQIQSGNHMDSDGESSYPVDISEPDDVLGMVLEDIVADALSANLDEKIIETMEGSGSYMSQAENIIWSAVEPGFLELSRDIRSDHEEDEYERKNPYRSRGLSRSDFY